MLIASGCQKFCNQVPNETEELLSLFPEVSIAHVASYRNRIADRSCWLCDSARSWLTTANFSEFATAAASRFPFKRRGCSGAVNPIIDSIVVVERRDKKCVVGFCTHSHTNPLVTLTLAPLSSSATCESASQETKATQTSACVYPAHYFSCCERASHSERERQIKEVFPKTRRSAQVK